MNNCLGFRKARPITGSLLKNENINIKRINIPKLNAYPSICNWFKSVLSTMPSALRLDRHYNYNIEMTVRLSTHKFFSESFNDTYEKNEQKSYESKRIPIILLRGYFENKDLINFCLKKGTYESYKRCINLMETDHFYKNGNNSIETYYKYANEYFRLILELLLLSFEKCFHIIVNKLYKKQWIPMVNLIKNIKTYDYWKGMCIPEKLDLGNMESIIGSGYLTLFVVLWRINASLVIERELFEYYYSNANSSLLCDETLYNNNGNFNLNDIYSEKIKNMRKIDSMYLNEDKKFEMENVRYNFLLFRDTHLPLLTIMVKKNKYLDIDIAYNGILITNYPSSFNICCIDELPDMTPLLPLMNTWYDTGSKRETSEFLIDALRHIYTIKPVNRICLIRNISKMLRQYSIKYPIVLELFKLTMKCVLLGNIP